jgi:DNA-binding CsgD family transcriptional regulator
MGGRYQSELVADIIGIRKHETNNRSVLGGDWRHTVQCHYLGGLSKRDRTKSDDRWSDAVMGRGHTIIPTILFWGQAKLRLTPNELNVLLQIISHWFYGGNDPHPSKDRIAERMKKHPRTVQAYLTSLEDKGFITRVERFKPNKGQDANDYDLSGLVAKLQAIAPEFKKVAKQNKLRRKRVEKSAG